MLKTLREDINVVMERDPAVKSKLEVLLCYPGLHAIIMYRISHFFYNKRLFLIARLISQFARFLTGIEIHPGAVIGRRLFIDHGMGIVIGETTEIGDDVTIYQGVTLGGTGKDKGKRHPTIHNNVTIGSGAKILGPITVGSNAKIGAGAVVLRCVPPSTTAVGVPAHTTRKANEVVKIDLNHTDLPDPVENRIKELEERIKILEEILLNVSESVKKTS
ncbi:serine O-acetyltransferase EpsC [Lutispora thermophila]|uniref:Serine acetyltransferase n=1 Tax=Lutispora thermophila DSM 19022 TaxID=1122184 RepID=A0A1M6CNX9_9FIRM|nr:serine O-acetyltransferase EpsC [Lutispora thermophila]SHI62690.1 serine O-acetyltransferase [Lutispora thermophila DSM 19022]